MKIERIAVNKIKVSVTGDDMRVWGISFDSLSENGEFMEDLFFDLMQRAESETGFVFENSHLLIEAMPMGHDGIVMYVTKMDESEAAAFGQKNPMRMRRSRYKVKRRQITGDGELVFSFNDFDDLALFAKETAAFILKSDLYMLKDVFYLCVAPDRQHVKDESLVAIAGEFGGGFCPAGAFVKEHGRAIVGGGDAVWKILKY